MSDLEKRIIALAIAYLEAANIAEYYGDQKAKVENATNMLKLLLGVEDGCEVD